ncbi:hypothetical protein H0B56_20220 [Haloechinothrix sp. YIM 98757]|uniref:PPE family protein n=1 Tax=Haloechinothrix aidingensis TaxID=2752311 RepID=A0A838AFI0_9PSEU|nr:hypothetical protein [Haloechinothrix aidingensis]MBA0127878.1 hypothetical protein [Haloechinothrix aidingensis]
MDPENTEVAAGSEDGGGQADQPEGDSTGQEGAGGETASGGGAGSGPLTGSDGRHEELVAALRAGDQGFMFGDDRAITNPPNWASRDSTQLYNGATMRNDPGMVDATGQAWSNHGTALSDVANGLFEAISQLGHAWIGQASGAAQGTLAAIARSSESAGEAARAMGARMTEQAAAAAEVKKMPPPREFDAEQALQAMLEGGPEAMTADLKAQSDAARDVKEQQIAYCNAYTAALQQTDDRTPSFGPESLALRPVVDSGGSGGAGIGGYGTGVGIGAGGGAAALGTTGAAAQEPVPARGVVAAGGTAAGHQQAPVQTAPPSPGTAGPAGPVTTSGNAPVSGSGGPGAGVTAGAAALAAGVGVGGAKAMAKANRSGSKQRPADGENNAQAGEQQASEEQQPPEDSGTAPAAPEQTSATANQAPAGGTAGQSAQGYGAQAAAGGPVPPAGTPMGGGGAGMAGGAGASAGGDEDRVHESYLIEPDPDELFGPGEAMTPPVIGMIDEEE